MATLDSNIILQGQPVNLLGAMQAGQGLAAQRMEFDRQREYQNMLAQNGAGILAGDAGAMNALAGYDPAAAMNIQNTRQSMQHSQQKMDMLTAEEARSIAEYKRKMSAEEAAAEATRIEQGVKMGLSARSPQEWDAMMAQVAPDMVGMFDQREMLAGRYMSIADILKQQNPEPADEYGRYVQETLAKGQQPLDRIGYAQALKGKGFRVQLADGTTIEQGGPSGGAYPGQDPTVTGTPRDDGKLATKLSENDAATLKEMQDAATTASDLESQAAQMGILAPQVGYTGPFGNAYGSVDDLISVLPGESGPRAAMRSIGTDAQLSFSAKTKGAITDREMALFASAVPGLGQTAAGNKMISEAMVASSKRTQTRANFYEAWARKFGSLEGAQEVWQSYMRDNPILTESNGSIAVRPEGKWQDYLNRKPAMGYSPQSISTMSAEELDAIPIEQMTPAQLDAIERRQEQLGVQP